jgi:hypothetical protein
VQRNMFGLFFFSYISVDTYSLLSGSCELVLNLVLAPPSM